MDINTMAERCLTFCKHKGWDRTWGQGGCYLHLESSEFVEALRGKGDNTPVEEAGDVMFVLFSMLANYNLKPSDALNALDAKLSKQQG